MVVVVGEEEGEGEEGVVVRALGGLTGAPVAVLSRLLVSRHLSPGGRVPGAGGVVAELVVEQVVGLQLLQVLPLAGLQGEGLSGARAGFLAGR